MTTSGIGTAARLRVAGAGIVRPCGALGVRVETRYRVECRDRRGNVLWIARAKNRVVTAGLNKLLDATFKTGLASPAWYIGLVKSSIADAAITSGTATLTSASNPWVAADAGRSIIVRGAGSAGADLVTTIATFNSAGNVTLAASASTTVSNGFATWDSRAADTMGAHIPWVENVDFSNATRPGFTAGTISVGSVDNSAAQAAFNMNVNNSLVFGCFLTDSNTVNGSTGTLYGMAVFGSPGSRQANGGDTINVTATLTVTST